MVPTDPVDARLLATVAELGRAAVHDVAARAGMDPREVASRLMALSATGLPLLVGVECDPNGIRAALHGAAGRMGQQGQPGQGQPSQGQPGQAGPGPHGPHPGGQPPGPGVHGTPSGGYSVPGAHSVRGTPSGPHPAPHGRQQAPPPHPAAPPQQAQQSSGPPPSPAVHAQQSLAQQTPHHSGPYRNGPQQSGPHRTGMDQVGSAPHEAAPTFGVWGPPQTSSWARGDEPEETTHAAERTRPGVRPAARSGKIGQTLHTVGLEGEQLAIQLVELVDPADFLFTAAGYKLADGERAVVAHTEMTNRGTVPFPSLPDLYLVLVTEDGRTIGKAPVSLSSRPSHGIGVNPGATAGGHTVFMLDDAAALREVRWSPQPGDEQRSLSWIVDDG